MMLAGEEITISYMGDLCDSVVKRRSRLQKGWDFTCKCPRCVVEAALPKRVKDLVANIQAQTVEDGSGTILAKYRQDCQTVNIISTLSMQTPAVVPVQKTAQ